MAAGTSSTAEDGQKEIRKLSLTYLKNTFHKKSKASASYAESVSSNDGDVALEAIENRELCTNRVTSSAARSIPGKSFHDVGFKEPVNEKSPGLLRNIKKRLHIRGLKLCKSKQKIKAIEPSCPSYSLNDTLGVTQNQLPIIFFNEKKNGHLDITQIGVNGDNGYSDIAHNSSGPESIDEDDRLQEEPEYVSSSVTNVAEPQASSSTHFEDLCPDPQSGNEKKFNLTEELLKLSKYGWYWGPISRDEAETKLANEPDGAFLVRDSSADKYLLTLSFKSSGKLLHTRVEHSGGLFSLYYHPECERFSSVVALINHSMSFSQSAVYCYSRPRYPGHPAFPVRLTKPVSRFTQVRSLQYLCRFVIRQNTRVDNIGKLPLPETIRGYIEEAHY